jgi:branched-chain amino acid transport system ATP-binding protein
VVVLLGPNGAGKSTTLLALVGEARVFAGEVYYHEQPTKAPLHHRARDGLAFLTEQRSVFMGLTVAQNLAVGRCDRTKALEHFPELGPLMGRLAGFLSGGEQQMLTLARALAREPSILVADELSLGLAPLVVTRLLAAVRAAADRGVGVLLVEQHIHQVLEIADRVYLMRQGRIEFSSTAAEARSRVEEIEASYLAGEREMRRV